MRARTQPLPFLIASLLAFTLGCGASKEHAQSDEMKHEHKLSHAHAGHQQHRFEDPAAYAEAWNDPERDSWQKPQQIIEAMQVQEGMSVVDLGAGTGYFLPHLSRAVGAQGQVLAVDYEAAMLRYIEEHLPAWGLENVSTRAASENDSGLDAASVDRILIVNTWHHIPNRASYAQHLFERLREGGSVWVVDFLVDSPSGPPVEHRLAPELVAEELRAGGFQAEVHPLVLQRQYLVVGKR